MATVEVLVDGKVVSSRQSTFDDAALAQDVADSLRGKNIRHFERETSRQRRKAKANGDQQ